MLGQVPGQSVCRQFSKYPTVGSPLLSVSISEGHNTIQIQYNISPLSLSDQRMFHL